jgi:hypothetical protein
VSDLQPYSDPVYAQPVAQPVPPRGLSIASMILGIAGLAFGWVMLGVPSIVGVVLGHIGLKREPAGRPFAITGLLTGYIGIGIGVLAALAFIASLLLPLLFLGGLAATGDY